MLEETLDRALTEQEKEDASFVAVIMDDKTSPQTINRLIADRIVDIRRAQVVQNHNSTLLAKRQTQIVYGQVGIGIAILAHILWGSPSGLTEGLTTLIKWFLLGH